MVTVNDTDPPGVLVGSSFPYAWVQNYSSGDKAFGVYTGVIINGSFAPANVSFDFEDSCR